MGKLRRMLAGVALTVLGLMSERGAAAGGLEGVGEGWERGLFGESVQELRLPDGMRAVVNLPEGFDTTRQTLVIVFACPNGNSIEWTLGGKGGDDWHFEIQHVLAQVRRVREVLGENERQVVLAVVEAEGKSWPAWRSKRANHGQLIREFIGAILSAVPGENEQLALLAHSGGGAFLWGYLNGDTTASKQVERMVFLDANYSFDEAQGHAEKLDSWLKEGGRLMVVAYDDRRVAIHGKPVLSAPERGTWGATTRMVRALSAGNPVTSGPFEIKSTTDGRAVFYVHANPSNEILHTRLVEWNGVVHGLLWGTQWENGWGEFGKGSAYDKWITSAPGEGGTIGPRFAARQPDAIGGAALLHSLAGLTVPEREERILQEIALGNVPSFLRRFRAVAVGNETVWVSPDYLAIGSDKDWVRVPLTRAAAERVMAKLGCVFPTVEVVDAIWGAAEAKVEPIPLAPRGETSELPEVQRVDKRESVEAFVTHQRLIEASLKCKPGQLVAGVKKDLVASERLSERPGRVAIYGWHRLDGKPIQPLSTVHGASYVDYSHGVRLVWVGR